MLAAMWNAYFPSGHRDRREVMYFFIFVSPWVIGFLCMTIFPLLWGGYMSLTNYTGLNIKNLKFVGMSNYVRAFKDPATSHGLWRTLYITALGVPMRVIGGFGLALLLNQKLKAQGFFRVLFYLPAIVPITATALIWQQILSRNAGLLNLLLEFITGKKGFSINWLSHYANESLLMLFAWGLGGSMVIYLAGLQNIPNELKEAAHVDGANRLQSFFHVTLPMMSPVLLFQTIMDLIWSLQILVPALLLSPARNKMQAGLTIPRANRLFMVHLYEQAFVYNRFGYGLALAWILFAVVFGLAILVFKSSAGWVHYESDVDATTT